MSQGEAQNLELWLAVVHHVKARERCKQKGSRGGRTGWNGSKEEEMKEETRRRGLPCLRTESLVSPQCLFQVHSREGVGEGSAVLHLSSQREGVGRGGVFLCTFLHKERGWERGSVAVHLSSQREGWERGSVAVHLSSQREGWERGSVAVHLSSQRGSSWPSPPAVWSWSRGQRPAPAEKKGTQGSTESGRGCLQQRVHREAQSQAEAACSKGCTGEAQSQAEAACSKGYTGKHRVRLRLPAVRVRSKTKSEED